MNSYPIDGMTVMPMGLPLMAPAWVACVQFALGEPEARAQFKAETGKDLESLVGMSPLSAMIDESTGYAASVMAAFADWVTVNVWGVEGAEE